MRLVIVGDADQLPSIGPGNVLRDLLDCGKIKTFCLTKIFRQAEGSGIIQNAHKVNRGEELTLSNNEYPDFFFMERADGDIPRTVVDLCARRLPQKYGLHPVRDVQVLTPMRVGNAGTQSLNAALQDALNPNKLCLQRGGVEYRLGDKLMQVRNNYDTNCFNGDVGAVCDVNPDERTLSMDFGDRTVEYEFDRLDELAHAYASTAHKSQGGEFPAVVLALSRSHRVMLERTLLYTAVTRAKRLLVIVGSREAISYAVQNHKTPERNSKLKERMA
jgi:exodeoxyribonuclease V alpha subunit